MEPDTPGQTTGFFEESPGNFSLMRLLSFLSECSAIVFGFLTVLGIAGPEGTTITLAFLGVGVGGKCTQKAIEVSREGNTSGSTT